MTRQATSSGFPLARGVQLTKELAVLNWEIQAAQNQLDKSWFDGFLTSAGINAGSSSGYSYRGASNYDVILNSTVDATRKLLVRGNATPIIDSSTGAKTITAGAGATFDSSVKKYGAGSVAFTGAANAKLTLADSADWELSTVDWQFDGWFRLTTAGVQQKIFHFRAPSNHFLGLEVQADNTMRYLVEVGGGAWGTGAASVAGATVLTTGVWYYFKLKKVSSTITLLLSTDGSTFITQATQTGYTGSGPTGSFTFCIGGTVAGDGTTTTGDFNGNIDDFRYILNGTTADTVPTAEADAATSAIVKSITVTMPSAITSVIAFVDTGAATPDLVRFSTDGGSTWTTIPTASIGKIVGVPSGTSCVLEVTISGATELEAWGFAGA